MEKKYEDKFPSFDGTNHDWFEESNRIVAVQREFKTYEIDFNKVHHIEDIKLILKSLNIVFDESAYEKEIGRLLKLRK